jgi:hypothetical protein
MKRGEKRMLNGFENSRRRLLFLVLAGLLMAMSQGALWEAIAADPTPESLVTLPGAGQAEFVFDVIY